MTNFDRIKTCKDEYEMTDIITGYIANNLHKMKSLDGPEFNCLPFLEWLRSDRNIFDEKTTNQ